MNRHEHKFTGGREARIQYLDGDFRIVSPGTFVRCAVTGNPIPVNDLKYWNVELQEAYVSAEVSLKRYRQQR